MLSSASHFLDTDHRYTSQGQAGSGADVRGVHGSGWSMGWVGFSIV